MSNIVSILDSVGRNAGYRYASNDELRRMLQRERVDPAFQEAVLGRDRLQIEALLGVRGKIYCATFAPKLPQKAPAKKPAKPEKKPSRKPAKKAPAKKTPAKKKTPARKK